MQQETRFDVTVPDEASAHAVAGQLAERGHLLVTVRQVQPSPYGEKFVGWWRTCSLVVDPPHDGPLEISPAENAAVSAIARRHGGRVNGACGRWPDEAIARFPREGLTHELDRAEADAIRARIVAGQARPAPTLPAAPGLKCGSFRRPSAELKAAGEVLQRTTAGPGLLFDVTTYENAGDLVAEIADAVMHQGTVGPDTPSAVPVLAGLVGAGGVSDFFRAMALMVLFQMGTAGRRRMAAQADEAALGTQQETPDEAATRAAVVAAVPALVAAGAGRSELAGFLLAAVAAAGRESGAGLPAGLDKLADKYAGTARTPVVALIRALAAGDEAAIRAALAQVTAARPDLDDGARSPKAAAEDQALDVLDTALQGELDQARLPLAGRLLAR
jgi:hypothetical protein